MSKVFMITEGLENTGAVKSGGQGSVYKGKRTGEIFTAIKLLPTPIISTSEDDKHYRDFINEVQKLQRVSAEPNPNVVKILSYGVSETGGFPYIEMEYIDGPDLGELLVPPHQPVFTVKEVMRVAEHLLNALAHCHRLDVKHGDIKSNNVKFNKRTGNYVLLDFGLAILSDEERRTSMRHAGAIEFMAPEQAEGRMLFETDVYSFGIVLYELLAGQVPFPLDGNSETARNRVMVAHMETAPPDVLALRAAALPAEWTEEQKALEMQVPDWLLSMIKKCLQKKPEDRFANGIVLQEYFSHHRIYTAQVTGLMKAEDQKWQALLNEREAELHELRTRVAQYERKAGALKESTTVPMARVEKSGVSRSAFNAVLLLLLLVAAAAVYGLFFNKPDVSGMRTDNASLVADSTALTQTIEEKRTSESSSAAKETKKPLPEKKKRRDSVRAAANTANEVQQAPTETPAVSKTEAELTTPGSGAEKDTGEEKDTNANEGEEEGGVRYKVRNKAYFHNEPDASTKREAFIVHWNNAVLKPLNEKDGFVYIVFTNHLGQTSKGWLLKDDLIPLK